jgi:hypothetical protein
MTVEISFQAELALPPLPGGNSQKTVRFHYLETTDFDCHRVENQFAGGRERIDKGLILEALGEN